MAYCNTGFCFVCNRTTNYTNGNCDSCRARELEEKEKAWQALPLEQKVEQLKKRIDSLESYSGHYCGPIG